MNDSFLSALIADGRPLLRLVAVILIGCGFFAVGQAATGHFLPHDTEYLGMTAKQLCDLHGCRIVHFMIHDRISFGGVLVAIGVMYLWLIEFPLTRGEPWGWWAIAASATAGFLSFLTYLGYGYLDTWHSVATLSLIPLYLFGLARTRPLARGSIRSLRVNGGKFDLPRVLLLLSTLGIIGGGLTIMTVGMTTVFVPQDLEFIGVDEARIRAISDRLVPLIAHDRAGFGGALFSAGIAMFLSVWCAAPSKSLWQALAIAGTAGFATAIGVHPAIGYNSVTHLAPAVLGALLFAAGLMLQLPRLTNETASNRIRRHAAVDSGPAA
jgi:hypothetical protein